MYLAICNEKVYRSDYNLYIFNLSYYNIIARLSSKKRKLLV